jgi:hypothetical protein
MLLSVWLSDGDYLEVWSDRVETPGQTYAVDEWFQAKIAPDPRAPLVVDPPLGIALRSHGGPWATYVPGRQAEVRRLMLVIGRACVARGIEPPEDEASIMDAPRLASAPPTPPTPSAPQGRLAPRPTLPVVRDMAHRLMRAPVVSAPRAPDSRATGPRLTDPRLADSGTAPAQPVRPSRPGPLNTLAGAPGVATRVQQREPVPSSRSMAPVAPRVAPGVPLGPASTPGRASATGAPFMAPAMVPGMVPSTERDMERGRPMPVVRRTVQRPANVGVYAAPAMLAASEDEDAFAGISAYTHSDKLLAAITHLSLLFCPGLLASAVWVALREDTPHVARHARAALLFQCVFYALALPLAVLTLLATGAHGPGLGAVIGLVALALLLMAGATCAFMAAVEALRGGPFSYLEIPRRLREPAPVA